MTTTKTVTVSQAPTSATAATVTVGDSLEGIAKTLEAARELADLGGGLLREDAPDHPDDSPHTLEVISQAERALAEAITSSESALGTARAAGLDALGAAVRVVGTFQAAGLSGEHADALDRMITRAREEGTAYDDQTLAAYDEHAADFAHRVLCAIGCRRLLKN